MIYHRGCRDRVRDPRLADFTSVLPGFEVALLLTDGFQYLMAADLSDLSSLNLTVITGLNRGRIEEYRRAIA